ISPPSDHNSAVLWLQSKTRPLLDLRHPLLNLQSLPAVTELNGSHNLLSGSVTVRIAYRVKDRRGIGEELNDQKTVTGNCDRNSANSWRRIRLLYISVWIGDWRWTRRRRWAGWWLRT